MLCGHIGIHSDSLIIGSGVHVANGAEDEMFQCLLKFLIISPHLLVIGVKYSGGRNLDGSVGARSVRVWVVRDDKGGCVKVVLDRG